MTNIVTRKGLAFGALVALASTAIAGAPAHAAGEVVFVPNSGTSYNAFVTDSFTLNASLAPGQVAGNITQLKYSIALPAALATGNIVAYKLNGGSWTNSTATSSAAQVIAGSGSATAANTLQFAIDTDSTTTGVQAPAATADTKSVTVTAFIDSNNNSVADAGEFAQARTVTFKKYSEVTPTVTVNQPVVGDASAKATVVVADMNYTAASLTAVFTGVTGATAAPGVAVDATTGVATDGTAVTSTAVTAQAYYGGVALGTAVSATPTARTISSVTADIVKGDNAIATSATTAATSTTGRVRTNGSFVAQVKVLDLTTPTALVKSGVAVVATVKTTATLSGTAGSVKSVTVAGTTYTSNTAGATFATVNLTSDASGLATVAVSSVGLTASDTVTVTFTAQNYSSAAVADFEDAAYTITEASTAGGYVTTPGATSTLKYAVKDQFGVAIAGAYRVKATITGGGRGSAAIVYSAPVSAGAATISVVDTQTTITTAASVAASLESQDSSTLNWSSATATGATTAILYSTTANGFSTAPAIDATNGINNGAWTVSGDQKQKITQSGIADLTASAAAGDTYAKLTFVAANQYQDVTVSGTGVYLALGATAPSADKLTFQAASGTTVIYVAANTIGTKTITFTSGATTKTVDVKFDTAGGTAARATAAKFAVAVPAAAQSGRAIHATVTVTDKYGNPVAGFTGTASVSGVAVVNGGYTAAVTTDANGQATVKLSAGVNDLGDAVVTFSDADSNTSTDVTSVAKTVTFGSTDGYIDVLNGKRASVTWSFAKGKRVAVYLDGVRRYNIVQPGDSELNLQFNLKKGSHSIKLVIGGVIVDTLSVKVAG